MAKKFTKLNLADIVATSGGKSFRKLSIEEGALTDLTGTIWTLNNSITFPSSQASYQIDGTITAGNYTFSSPVSFVSGSNTYTLNYFRLYTTFVSFPSIYNSNVAGSTSINYSNSYGWYLKGNTNVRFSNPVFTITGGADVTNSDFIAWLEANATRVS